MKITSLPQVYRNANRWREILQVLSRYGLAGWLSRFDLPFTHSLFTDDRGKALTTLSHPERIRCALEELGPTFIKLGQMLSTRPDQIGLELAEELSKLQSNTQADETAAIREMLSAELGRPVAECFAQFDDKPFASASIGQVHRATLRDGTPVAVKIRHAGIVDQVEVDTDILVGLAELAARLPELANYRPQATAREFQRVIRRELDFAHEARRLEQFAGYFADDTRVRIPQVYNEFSTGRVLTTGWLEGRKVSDPAVGEVEGIDPQQLARNGATVFLEMIFDHGVYHADPHPGNLLVLPGNVLGLVDFGMVGQLGEPLREDLEDMLLAVVGNDPVALTAIITRVGATPSTLDEAALSADVADFVEHYGRQSLGGFDIAGALRELIEIVRRYEIVLPASLSMLLKLIVMLEGTAQRLSPDFSLLEVLEPMQRKMMLQRLSPTRQAKKIRRIYGEVEMLAEVLPRRVREILQQVQTGKFDVHLDHRGLEPSVNRLVLGMMTSALFLGSSLLLSRGVWPIRGLWLLEGVSTPGLAGLGLSGLLGLRVLWAISKSGALERRK